MIIVLIKILRIYSCRNQDSCSNGVNFCIQCINRCIKYKVTAGHRKAFIYRTYYPTTCNTCYRWQLNPDIQILQTDLHTISLKLNFCIQCINRCIKYKVTAGHRKAFIYRTYYPTTCNTCYRWQLNPDIQILQTDLHTISLKN